MTARRGKCSRERGAVAVEFAITLPVLVMLLIGIVQFGRAYSARIALTHAAQEAVRVVALNTGDPAAVASAAASRTVTTTVDAGCPADTIGDAQVTVSYSMDLVIPFVPTQNVNMSQTARMRCGVGS